MAGVTCPTCTRAVDLLATGLAPTSCPYCQSSLVGAEQTYGADDVLGLPAPKRPGPLSSALGDDSDLLAPAARQRQPAVPGAEDGLAPVSRGIPNIPGVPGENDGLAPVRRSRNVSGIDLPAPVSGGLDGDLPDLLAPVQPPPAGITDLPAPVNSTTGLPAPKGFFDDAVRPVDRTGGVSDLPAPKGFFDDALQPVPGRDLPAPKGFFDDGVKPAREPGQAAGPPGDLPAPKGFFDDSLRLDEPLAPSGAQPLDLGAPAPPVQTQAGLGDLPTLPPLELSAPQGGATPTVDLGTREQLGELGFGGAPPNQSQPAEPLSLDDMELQSPGGEALNLDDLALSSPSASSSFGAEAQPAAQSGPQSDGVVSFSKPSGNAQAAQPAATRRQQRESNISLDLDGGPADVRPQMPPAAAPRLRAGAPDKKAKAKGAGNRRKWVLVGVLGVAVIGAGGYYGFTKWQEKRAVEQTISSGVSGAQKAMLQDTPGHWDRADKEAKKALSADGKHGVALALRAQANFAGVLDTGQKAKSRAAEGKKAVKKLRSAAVKGPEADKAEGLQSLYERRTADAQKRLRAAVKAAPKDANAKLFLGWAELEGRDATRAKKQFQAALKLTPGRIPALYGLGQAQLALGERDAARESYLEVIESYRKKAKRDHLGALVGVAQLSEVEKFTDREKRFLEILAREGLEKEDPRAVSMAWSLAGKEALRAGRVQEAEERFAKAISLEQNNLDAYVGEGNALAAQDKLEAARGRFRQVLAVDTSNLPAAVGMAGVNVREKNLAEAQQMLDKVLRRDKPIDDVALLAEAHSTQGEILALEGKADKAIENYKKAIELVGKTDIGPSLALARLYAKLGRQSEADALLDPIQVKAETDPAVAVTLGVAYLSTNNATGAERAFRSALAQRPDDLEARYQLGRALIAQERVEEGLAAIKSAFEANRSRDDIGLDLAIAYEQRKLFDKAEATYADLLKASEPSLAARSRAGRFYARHGKLDQAVAIGEKIRSLEPRNPAGIYLEGEQAYAAGEYDRAYKLFVEAANLDPAAQYFEAAGRGAERLGLLDDAMDRYGKALSKERDNLPSRLGRARIRHARREFKKAIAELMAANRILPNNADIQFGIGLAYLERQRFKKSAKYLEIATKLDPKHAEAWYRLGRAYYDLDKPKDSARSLANATRLAEPKTKWLTEGWRLLGYARKGAGDRRGAIKALKVYLDREQRGGAMVKEARKLVVYLEAGGR